MSVDGPDVGDFILLYAGLREVSSMWEFSRCVPW